MSGQNGKILIAVMGATGSGKTTFVNGVSGANLTVGHGLTSCTSEVQVATCPSYLYNGYEVALLDTPGFDDTEKQPIEILRTIAAYLETTYSAGYKLSGVIFLHRISDPRVSGTTRSDLYMFQKLCGEAALKNVIFLTTRWDKLSSIDEGAARERELMENPTFFGTAIRKGATCTRLVDNSPTTAQKIVTSLLATRPRPEALKIQRELVDERLDITDTAAAQEINKDVTKKMKEYQRQVADLQAEVASLRSSQSAELKEAIGEMSQAMQKMQETQLQLSEQYQAEVSELRRELAEKDSGGGWCLIA